MVSFVGKGHSVFLLFFVGVMLVLFPGFFELLSVEGYATHKNSSYIIEKAATGKVGRQRIRFLEEFGRHLVGQAPYCCVFGCLVRTSQKPTTKEALLQKSSDDGLMGH